MAVEEWSEEERKLVASFYGLPEDNLSPSEWIDLSAAAVTSISAPPETSSDAATESDDDEAAAVAESLASTKALLQEDRDPLGLSDAGFKRALQSEEGRDRLLSASAQFSPSALLLAVHSSLTLEELRRGKQNLEALVLKRDCVIRELVRHNFARFVRAKNAIDGIHADMQQSGLLAQSEQGQGLCREGAGRFLGEAQKRAIAAFQPLVEKAEAEASIRKRLDFLDRYSDFFALPKRLREARLSGDLLSSSASASTDISVVGSYRKAKVVLHDTVPRLLRDKRWEGDALRRFWRGQIDPELDLVRESLRGALVTFSCDTGFEECWGLMLLLKALDAPAPDPFDQWLQAYCLNQLNALDAAFASTQEALASVTSNWRDDDVEGSGVRAVLSAVIEDRPVSHLDLLEVSIAETKLKRFILPAVMVLKRTATVLVDAVHKHEARREIVKQFIEHMAARIEQRIASLLGPESSGGCHAAVLLSVMGLRACLALADAANAIMRITICTSNTDLALPCHSALLAVAKAVIETAWRACSVDCAQIAKHCQWSIDAPDSPTQILRVLEVYLFSIISATSSIMRTVHTTGARESPAAGVDRLLGSCIGSFIDSLKTIILSDSVQGHDTLEARERDEFRLDRAANSYRLLLGLCNLVYLRQVALPRLLSAFQRAAIGSLSDAVDKSVIARVDSLDILLTQSYLSDKQEQLIDPLLKSGLLDAAHTDTSRPRPYIYELLTVLAVIQTEIGDVSRVLVRLLLGDLVTGMFSRALSLVRAIPPGALTVQLHAQLAAELGLLEELLATAMSDEAGQLAAAAHSALDSISAFKSDSTPAPDGQRVSVQFSCVGALQRQFSSFQFT